MSKLSDEEVIAFTKRQMLDAARDLERAANNLQAEDPADYVQGAISRTHGNLFHTLVRYTEWRARKDVLETQTTR